MRARLAMAVRERASCATLLARAPLAMPSFRSAHVSMEEPTMTDLAGRIVWITGAGSGVGESAALGFAAAGATVVLTARRAEPLAAVAARITAAGGRATCMPGDLARRQVPYRIAQDILAAHGRIDILVNNAGLNVPNRGWKDLDADTIALLVDANLTSAMFCAHAVLPAMRAQGDGILIHTASGAGRWVSLLSGPGYTAAKHGMVAMSHQLNMSECVNGIRSMVICPGEIATPILKNRPIPLTQQELDRMLKPEDVADMMLYCARLPRHVNLNEVVMLPAWNRAYVAALDNQARERAAKGG
jgi:NADP-dependent 3-hydroxy acid dehydrogenase YdfG